MHIPLALAVLLATAATASAATYDITTVRTDDPTRPHAFEPAEIQISAGDTIRWTNGDGVYHTVKASASTERNEPANDYGGPLGAGATYEHTFDEGGTYRYFCQPHAAFMHGLIHVQTLPYGPPPTPQTNPDPPRDTPSPGIAALLLALTATAAAAAARKRT